MKRVIPRLFCRLAFTTFTVSSLAAGIGAPGAAEHVSRGADNETVLEPLNESTIADPAAVLPEAIVSTRSSFTTRWNPISQATRYRLDISISPSFDSYVTGYRDLEVGSATWRIVTGLSPGTTYYCRVTGVSETGSSTNSEAMTGTTA